MNEWSNSEIELFKELYPKETTLKLIEIFGRSKGALETKAYKLNIKKEIKADGSRPFTVDEVEFLKSNYGLYSSVELAKIMNRNANSIKVMASKLKLKSSFWWTDEEILFLKENFESKDKKFLCQYLNKEWKAIGKKAREIGLNRTKLNGDYYTKNEPITEEENNFIIENYKIFTSSDIARVLQRSIVFVESHCEKLDLSIYKKRKNPNSFSDEKLLSMLKDKEKELGRPITSHDIIADDKFPAIDIYYDRFETFSNALILAGLDFFNANSYGKRCLSKNGDICYSFSEKIITDFLIDNNIFYEKDLMYKDIIPDFTKKYCFDWLLKDGVIVEFFGLKSEFYNKKMIEKQELCIKNGIELMSLYQKDLYDLNNVFSNYIL